MNEETQARQLSQVIDTVLNTSFGTEKAAQSSLPPGEVEIIRRLATADFSQESQVRQSLKLKLLNTPIGEKDIPMNIPIFQRPMARIAIVGLIIALLLVAVSPLGSTLAQSLIETVQQWRLGENSTAVSVSGDFEALPADDGTTIVQAPSESPERLEEGAAGQEPVAVDQARRDLEFQLLQPTFIPEGYQLNGVSVGGSGQASVEYFNLAGEGFFGILQTAVGGDNGSVQVTFSSDAVVEDVTINDIEGLWIGSGEEGLLVWETGGVNYQISGLGDLDLALRIAESLQ